MSPQAIGKVSTASAATIRPTTTKNFNDLQSEDFFGLLIAQLQSQDPLKPTDNQTLLNQMSSIRQMEQSTTLTKTLSSLAAEQRFGSTAGLIGQFVEGAVKDSGGNSVAINGVVTSVRYEDDGSAILELHNGRELPAEKVDFVTLVENLPADLRQRILTEMNGAMADDTTTQRTAKTDTARTAVKTQQPAYVPENGLVGGFLNALFGTGAGGGVSL